MPRAATLPPRFPLTAQQARAATAVVFRPTDPSDKLTPYLPRMVEGDMWLRGLGWVGPWVPRTDATPEAAMIREETRRSFLSRNVLAEANSRHASGVLGREPRWDLVSRQPLGRRAALPAAQQTLRDEAVNGLTAWWDRVKPHHAMKQALAWALYKRRGVVRPFVHPGLVAQLVGSGPRPDDGTFLVPPVRTIEDALALIDVEAVDPESGAVTRSPRDGTPVSVVFYDEIDDTGAGRWQRMEWTFLAAEGDTTVVDLRIEDVPEGQEILRPARTRPRGEARPSTATTFRLGGRVPVVQFEREPLITPHALTLQAALNFALSVVPRVLGDAGWMERIFTNAEPPGTWEYDEYNKRKPGTFTPGPFYTGPRTTNFMQGVQVESEDATGVKTAITPVGVHWRPPVDPAFAIRSARALYLAFLEEVDQAHVFLKQEGEASGRSHEMARADYEASLDDSATVVNPAGRTLLEAILALAEDLMDAPGRYTSFLRAEFQCRLSVGQRTADEEQADNQAIQAGRLSRTTSMERSGIDDVAAELERIAADPDVQLARRKTMAEVMGAFTTAGLDQVTAAKLAGFEPAEITLIQNMPEEQIDPEPADDAPED